MWSRHGLKQYINRWFDDCCQKHKIKPNEVTEFIYNDTYICACVKIEDINIQHICDECLRSICGKIHFQCE